MTRGLRRLAVIVALVVVDGTTLALAVAVAEPRWFMVVPLQIALIVLFSTGGLYSPRARLTVLDDLPAIMGRVIVAGTVVTCIDLVTDGDEGRETLLTAALFGLFVVPARAAAYAMIRRARRTGRAASRTLVVGSSEAALQLTKALAERTEFGYRPIGHLGPRRPKGAEPFPVPRLGQPAELVDHVDRHDVAAVVITYGVERDPLPAAVVRECGRRGCEILVLPRFAEFGPLSRNTELVWGLPLVHVRGGEFAPQPQRWRGTRRFGPRRETDRGAVEET